MRMASLTVCAIGFLLSGVVAVAHAAPVIFQPVTATASNTGYGLATYATDGSGMPTGNTLPTGSAIPGTYPTHGVDRVNKMWLTSADGSSGNTWITFQLVASGANPVSLQGFHLWNFNEFYGGYSNTARGAVSANVTVSVDGVTYIAPTTPTAYTFTEAPGLTSYTGENYALTASQAVRYVRFNNVVNFNTSAGNYVGLAEIRFTGEQMTGPLRVDGAIVQPISVTANTSWGDGPANAARDGSGLSSPLATGVLTPATYPTHGVDRVNKMWLSNSGWGDTGTAQITFQLTDLANPGYALAGFHLWNFNETGNLDRGMRVADVAVSSDGVNFSTPTAFAFTKASGLTGYTGEDYGLAAKNVRFVRFSNVYNFSNASGNFVGFAEVRFIEMVPEPSGLVLLAGTGLAGLAAFGLRRRDRASR